MGKRVGYTHSDETKAKIGAGVGKAWENNPKKDVLVEELRKRGSNGGKKLKGFKHSQKSRQNMSKAARGYVNTPAGKAHMEKMSRRLSEVTRGVARSEEHKLAISLGIRNMPTDVKERKAESSRIFMTERWEDEEYREYMQQSSSRLWEDMEYRKRITHSMSDHMAARWADPVDRQAMLESQRSEKTRTRKSVAITKAYLEGKFNPKSYYKTGYYHSTKMDADFHYRSSYELKAYQILDTDPFVVFFLPEPIAIPYLAEDGQVHHYVPDLYVEYKSGYWQFLEIKPEARLKEADNELKHRAAMDSYPGHFKVWTEANMEQVS